MNRAGHVSNRRSAQAEKDDFYATDPKAVELLLQKEVFCKFIIEPACGQGHIAKVLEDHGHVVICTDLIDRGFGLPGIDFLKAPLSHWYGDIVTNPPYKLAKEFVEKSLQIISDGHKVAMFLKLTFLEGQSRRELFIRHPPKTVYVSSARLECGKNGVFTGSSAVSYCWIIWEKGYAGETRLAWFN